MTKTYKNLFDQIIQFDNILLAYQKAAKGKTERSYVLRFTHNLERNLLILQRELLHQAYHPCPYQTFTIYEPKQRLISVAAFRDRIVHHMIINIIGPLVEKSFIDDLYSNREFKGSHKAILRYQKFSRKYHYVLKCDIRKYFATIDHAVLKKLIARKIADNKLLALLNTIIDYSNEQERIIQYFPGDDLFSMNERRVGLPLGNLTSQFFANWYLNDFDHFVKEQLRCKAYVRYMDDFVLMTNDRDCLYEWHEEIQNYLINYRLTLNRKRTQLYPVIAGGAFLGQVVYPSHRCLRGENVRRFRKRSNAWSKFDHETRQKLTGWMGHAMQADAIGLIGAEIKRIKRQIIKSDGGKW